MKTIAISRDQQDAEVASLNDSDLVLMAKGGDRQAFDLLTARHYKRGLRMAISILHQEAEAHDQVQSAFFKAFKGLQQFEERAQFSTWLGQIIKNECFIHLRGQRRRQFVYLDTRNPDQANRPRELLASAIDPECRLVMTQLATVLHLEMRHLPPLLRNIILLREIDKLSMSEIAARLGISEAAAKSRLNRARHELRARLIPHCGKFGWRMPASIVRSLPARGFSSRRSF